MAIPNLFVAASLTQDILNAPAQLASGETAVLTVGTNQAIKIATAALCNSSGSTVTVSVSLVPSGGAASVSNRVISGFPLGAGDSISQEDGLSALKGAMLGEGDFVSVNVSSGSAVSFVSTGVRTA